jgi:hypothetical protein
MDPHAHDIIMKRLKKHIKDPSPPARHCAPRITPLHGPLIEASGSNSQEPPLYASANVEVCLASREVGHP